MKFRLKTLIKQPTDKQLLKLWREVALLRAKGSCEFCGRQGETLNAHHIFSRSHRSTRYDPDNAIILCAYHHALGNDSAHKDPMFWPNALKKGIRTLKDFEILERRAKTPAKIDMQLEKLALETELRKLS
jgi:hypothetical protein